MQEKKIPLSFVHFTFNIFPLISKFHNHWDNPGLLPAPFFAITNMAMTAIDGGSSPELGKASKLRGCSASELRGFERQDVATITLQSHKCHAWVSMT